MWYNFKIECQRYFNEMLSFKFNLFFANTGLIFFFNGLLSYMNIENKESVLILLFLWYFATHGFININYIIEEEVMDGTFAHVLMTHTSFLRIVFLRSIIQVAYDFLKAVIVFGIILYVGDFNFDWMNYKSGGIIVFFLILSIFITYFIGLIIGALTLHYKKISAIPNLFYYFVLFFGGILYDVSGFPLLNKGCYFLPFLPFKNIVYSVLNSGNLECFNIIVLAAQFVIYFSLGVFLYKKYLKKILKKGSVFYV